MPIARPTPRATSPPRPGAATRRFLHGQAYGAAINNDGTADCENGQRGYLAKLAVFAGKDVHGNPFLVGTDPHTPGSQGPTFKGLSKVPAGETFTREPETGAQLPSSFTPDLERRHETRPVSASGSPHSRPSASSPWSSR